MTAFSDASAASALADHVFAPSFLAVLSARASIHTPRLAMYIIDVTHYLNDKGAIAPQKGPARRFAEFVGAVVAAATHPGREMVAPGCFKCRKAPVQPDMARDGAVVWSCPRCATEGRISNWRGSLWDLGQPEAPPH